MKNFFCQITGLTCLALLFSCSSPQEKNKIGEPNNSILEVGILQSGEIYSMKIDSIGDIDWFALPVPGQGYINVSAKNLPPNLNLVVRFANKEEWKPTKEKWIGGELGLPATIAVHQADTIYFVLKDKYHKNASEESIEFKAEFIAEFDEHEPNNDAESAKLIATGEIIKSAFYPSSDVDWFKTKVDSLGYLMIQARTVPENLRVETRFAKKPDDFGDIEFISGSLGLPAAVQVSSPGEYYFQLKDKYNAEMSTDMAEWKVDFIPEMDATEPNNSFAQAYRLAVNDTVQIAIFPQGDKDYFVLTPNANSTLRIASKIPKDFRPEIQIYDVVDFEHKPIGSWQPLPATFEVEANHKYFIQLQTKFDSSFSPEPFDFSVSRINDSSQ